MRVAQSPSSSILRASFWEAVSAVKQPGAGVGLWVLGLAVGAEVGIAVGGVGLEVGAKVSMMPFTQVKKKSKLEGPSP
jgi:hypothetical protein